MNSVTVLPRVEWPYLEVLVRLALGLALGLLIGLERERRAKEAGLRTFGFIALLGALGGVLGEAFALSALAVTALLTIYLNAQTLLAKQGTELTTSAAMFVTCVAGILCGQGHRLSPAAVIVSTTALLAWKQPLAGFTKGITETEVRSALLLAILAIVIYPALPEGPIGPWNMIEPRAAWVTVLLIAGIGFVNYVMWKLYGTRGADIAGFLGGLVNSSVTVIELAARAGKTEGRAADAAYRGIVLATAAMLARNVTLLGLLAPGALLGSAGAFALMLAACTLLLLPSWRHAADNNDLAEPQVALELPFSLSGALRYGALFVVLSVAGTLTLRFLGPAAFYGVSFVGGLLSSASAVASAAGLVSQHVISAQGGAAGALLASLASILFNLPFVLRAHNRQLTRRLVVAMGCVVAAGLLGAGVWVAARPWLASLP